MEQQFKAALNNHIEVCLVLLAHDSWPLFQDYNDLRTKKGLNPVGFRLTTVEKVANPVLEARFAARHKAMKERSENKLAPEELRERVAFHGLGSVVVRCSSVCVQGRTL